MLYKYILVKFYLFNSNPTPERYHTKSLESYKYDLVGCLRKYPSHTDNKICFPPNDLLDPDIKSKIVLP